MNMPNQDDLTSSKSLRGMTFSSAECAPLPPIVDPVLMTYEDVCHQSTKFNSDPTILRSRHTKRVSCLDWHWTGKYLASGSVDGTVCIYLTETIIDSIKRVLCHYPCTK